MAAPAAQPVFEDAAAEAKAAQDRQVALQKVYRHYLMTCCQTVMPFAQKQQVLLALPGIAGDASKAAIFSASLSSAAGISEFILCPILGKMSDACGRKSFMKIGPLADIICYGAVWLNPSKATLWLQALLGTPLNTFSGTTCAGASIMDIFQDHGSEMGNAFGGILTPVGLGLISGPLIGQAMVKLGKGNPTYAYLGASLCAMIQFLNVQTMTDTLRPDRLQPFKLALADLNPLTFLKLFALKGRSELLKLSLMTGFLQKADEGKNLADLHQVYAMNDLGLSQAARGNFVSCVGLCVLIGARSAKVTMKELGGHGHTTFSNLISVFALAYFSVFPQKFKKQAWPMFLGLFISALGWNADSYVKARGTKHAEAAGIGNGEYSAMLSNLRSCMTSLAPTLYANTYAWSTSGGRSFPGAAYLLAAAFKILAELFYQSMSAHAIDNPTTK